MSGIRTDLAEEMRTQAIKDTAKENGGEIDGVIYSEEKTPEAHISTICVTNENGEKVLGRKKGKYITLSYDRITDISFDSFSSLCALLSGKLRSLAEESAVKLERLLVCGLGNRGITPDSIGPRTVDRVIITHHMKKYNGELFRSAGFFDICAISPGVTSQTGMEALDIIASAVGAVKPDMVIAVDSLAAREAARLAKTIQIGNAGIAPGSGIMNSRASIDAETLGIPVLAIGVPTVVDTGTLVRDALSEICEDKLPEKALGSYEGYFVSPKDIDSISESCSRLIGYAINRAFHGDIPYEEMELM